MLAGVGCGRKSDESAAPAATALAASTPDPATASWHCAIDAKGMTHVELPGLKEHIQGDTSAASGALDIVPADLAKSRGLIRVDLSTFATRTFGDEGKDATQTKHARTWLEVVVDGKMNESLRWAEFAIRSIDGLSASDLRSVSPTLDGGDDVRNVTMTVHGDLLVHGHKVPKEDIAEVAFRFPSGASPTSKPKQITIKSKQPMQVVLKEHDVSPRDPAGQVLAWTTSLISKVAETASVTVDLTATPLP